MENYYNILCHTVISRAEMFSQSAAGYKIGIGIRVPKSAK